MSHCVNVNQLRAFKDRTGVPYNLSSFSDNELQVALDEAEERVELVCGTKFYTLRETWLFDGNGTTDLLFAPNVPYPLLSVESVTEVDSDDVLQTTFKPNDEFVASGHFLRVGPTGSGVRLRRLASTLGYWPVGVRNIKVTGLWGWAKPPLAIQRAIKLLAMESLIEGSTGMSSTEAASKTWPDFSISYRSVSDKAPSATGFIVVDRILKDYVCMSSLFMQGNALAYCKSSTPVPSEAAGSGVQVLVNDPNFPEVGSFWYNSTQRVWKGFNGSNIFVLGSASTTSTPIPSEPIPRTLQMVTSDPAEPTEGSMWYNMNESCWKCFNGVTVSILGGNTGLPPSGVIAQKAITMVDVDPTSPNIGDIWYNMADKVWKTFNGAEIFVIGSTDGEAPPTAVVMPTIQSGSLALLTGLLNKNIVMSSPMAVAPTVIVTISKPTDASGNIFATVSNVTTTGFHVSFSADIPTSGYTLNWIARV